MTVLWRCFAILPSNLPDGKPRRVARDSLRGLVELPDSVSPSPSDVAIDFDKVFRIIILKAVDLANRQLGGEKIACERGFDLVESGDMMVQFVRRICQFPLTITDVTTFNPNVFLEYGIREATRPGLNLLIAHEGVVLPSNINRMRCMYYSMDAGRADEAREVIADALVKYVQAQPGSSSPVMGLHTLVEEYSGRALEQKLAATYDVARRKPEPTVQELLIDLASTLNTQSASAGNSSTLPLVWKFLRGIGKVLAQDKPKAVQYYQLLDAARLPRRERVHVWEALMEIHGDLGDPEKRAEYASRLEALDREIEGANND
jgi:hypothetical protein